jgi:threonyl-tRNA synthetase
LSTPHIADLGLWKTSGHYDFYREDMFSHMVNAEKDQMQLKPMNCPFHCLVYKEGLKSYKDLPIRWAELGTVYRYERSGTLHGLMRARGFTQDDAHIFCLPSQLEDEIVSVLDLTESILNAFGFSKFEIMLSTRPKDSIGSDEIWDLATDALRNSLNTKNMSFTIEEEGGAFYGPKIDVKIEDALGRKWQCSTIQCDFNLPERFDLEYVDADQSRKRPIMLHRAIFGSLERFFGILIENTAADFPLWLAPVHARLLPVTDEAMEYCKKLQILGRSYGLRIAIDTSNNRIAKQIRNAEMEKIPVMTIVGKKEVDTEELSVRIRGVGELEVPIPVTRLFGLLQDIVVNKRAYQEVDFSDNEVGSNEGNQ